MTKRFLHTVTITGCDDSVTPSQLLDLRAAYSFVEFGVLLSRNPERRPRYPSLGWVLDVLGWRLPLSGHVCGEWCRRLIGAAEGPTVGLMLLLQQFRRVQLNVGAAQLEHGALSSVRATALGSIILQCREWPADRPYGCSHLLFDRSGGRGTLHAEPWPAPPFDGCGYAGGLTPENVGQELEKMAAVVGERTVWIDAESGLRHVTAGQDIFDVYKAEAFLAACAPYVLTKE